MPKIPTKKSPRDGAPQISLSSWILGGPIVVRPRLHPLPPVLVTTESVKAPKKAEAAKSAEKPKDITADKPVENGNKTIPEAAISTEKVDQAKANTATHSNDINGSVDKSNNFWTPEQDALLLQLKAANTSWKDITSKMSLSKSTVQARYKELKKNHNASTAPPVTVVDTENKTNNVNDNFTTGNWNQGDVREAEGFFWDNTRLTSDYNWTRQDCEMLEMLELRYREEKWLSIQASFYNLTGRMIAADVIKEKLAERSH